MFLFKIKKNDNILFFHLIFFICFIYFKTQQKGLSFFVSKKTPGYALFTIKTNYYSNTVFCII